MWWGGYVVAGVGHGGDVFGGVGEGGGHVFREGLEEEGLVEAWRVEAWWRLGGGLFLKKI